MSEKELLLEQTQLVESEEKLSPQLSDNALKVIAKRYLIKDRELKPLETAEDMFCRVAKHIAQGDALYGASKEEITHTEQEFYEMLAKLEFLPNSPTFTGAGTKIGQLAACFVLPVEDDMRSILKTQMDMGMIHKSGGGTGFSFSRLRPKNDVVGTTGGISSGPMGFLQMYNDTTECIKQGGTRRGANMGILRIDHPDILDFIDYKETEGTLNNFNISVALTGEFMDALSKDKEYTLVNPRDKKPAGTLKAKEVFGKIVDSAWRNGEPGIIFLDKINEKNPTPQIGEIEATNPCITADTWIMTAEGPFKVQKLIGKKFTALVNGERWESGEKGFFATGIKLVYRLRTKEGLELRLTSNHKLLRIKKRTRYRIETEWQEAGKLKAGDEIVINQCPAKWSGKYTFKEGYLIGLLLGDGTIKKDEAVLSCWGKALGPTKVRAAVVNSLAGFNHRSDFSGWTEVKERNEYRLKLATLSKFVFSLGLKPGMKQITEEIEGGSSEFCRGLIRGLFDADGTVLVNPEKGSSIRLTQSNLPLLQAVQRILLRLGIYSKIYAFRRDKGTHFLPDGKGGSRLYRIRAQHELAVSNESMTKFAKKIGFEDVQKQTKLMKIIASYKRTANRDSFTVRVINLTPVNSENVYDAQIPGLNYFDANGFMVHNCGEQPLLPYESCNLGAINLKKFAKIKDGKAEIDWEKLAEIIPKVVHFMDNVIDINKYPIPEIEKMTKKNRKIGITVMGFADLLYLIGVPYDSKEGIETAAKIMAFIKKHSHQESQKLAKIRGEFANFSGSIWDKKGAPKMRNAATTSCNPTGTLSIIGSCSSGIEPFFAIAYTKTVMDNDALPEVNEHFLRVAKEREFYSDNLMKEVQKTGSIQGIDSIPEDVKKVFKVASDIAPEWHVKMQAAFQKHTDGAISKTINFANSATREDVEKAYLLAYKLDCKGLTVYRDGSRNVQVLTTGTEKKEPETDVKVNQLVEAQANVKITPRERPDIIRGYTYRIKTAYGKLFITINDDEFGAPFEVFSHLGKAGGFFAAKAEAICRLISLALRSGIAAEEVIDQLKGIRGPTPTWSEDGKMILSLPDAIAQVLEKHLKKEQANLGLEFKTAQQPTLESDSEISQTLMANGYSQKESQSMADFGEAPACPECGAMLEFSEGCLKCNACGYSKCG